MSRKIGVMTTGRADFGICLPIAKAIASDPDLELYLIASGMHLAPEFGLSESDIMHHGFAIDERIEMLVSSDTPEGIAKSMGLATVCFAQSFSRVKPDILLVIGDRFEVHAAVAATVPFGIPVAHVHGGEITEGAMDELFRHSITKMSHLHFATTLPYAERIGRMGEEQWRITVSGAPGLDNFLAAPVPDRAAVEQALDLDLGRQTLLVTYHPVTRGGDGGQNELAPLLSAIRALDKQVILTYPNADTGGRSLAAQAEEFAQDYPKAKLVVNASQDIYIGLLGHVCAMAGNSSSGIIEAPSFNLPVVNIGPRQAGRIKADNVVDAANDEKSIVTALRKALSEPFRSGLDGLTNPYGDGRASERIVEVLRDVDLGERLLYKKFSDRPE